jgi:hypothetical protein
MIRKIKNLIRGTSPTLLNTEKANELIDAVNALQNITIEEGSETRVDVNGNGVHITIRIPQPKIPPPTYIRTHAPLKIRKTGENIFELWLEGYSKNIKYCGGSGHLLHLNDEYDSSEEVRTHELS